MEQQPDWMLVQGDSTTAMVAAAVAFYRRVRIGHVEAGLRTSDLGRPFPEELNRRIADLCADLCFAPKPWAHDNLLLEGVPASRIHVTDNTVVDAAIEMAARPYHDRVGPLAAVPRTSKWVLLTAHRRESFGAPLPWLAFGTDRAARAHRRTR
jgi:UDP-N-acetylglucosamine 2-epimerase (non-hydrolysing)